ncbi:MAG: hypothetical protein IPJ65_00580 [Archangiaceae bacterium]|nr:hypothetical protein [Archangiaceae bacterium]
MSALDLHPEELLDKAAAGSLSDSERVWLDQHLAQCSVCRFEQAARADFAAAAAPVADVQVDDLVARALAGMPTAAPAFTGRRSGSLRFVAAAAVAMFAVGSFAAVFTGALPRFIEKLVTPVAVPAPAPTPVSSRPVQQVAPKPVEVEEVTPAEPIPDPVEPAPAPARAVVGPKRVGPHRAALDAAGLFQAGNAARIRGDRAEAALRYGELLRQFSSSDEARLTHAMFGRMLLDSGDVRGALAQLDAYLELGDPTLREEAMSARARALALLGRTGEEAAAWRALLEQYPDSVHAERAAARLRELR